MDHLDRLFQQRALIPIEPDELKKVLGTPIPVDPEVIFTRIDNSDLTFSDPEVIGDALQQIGLPQETIIGVLNAMAQQSQMLYEVFGRFQE